VKGFPPQQLEWVKTMVGTLESWFCASKGIPLTNNAQGLKMGLKNLHEYSWNRF